MYYPPSCRANLPLRSVQRKILDNVDSIPRLTAQVRRNSTLSTLSLALSLANISRDLPPRAISSTRQDGMISREADSDLSALRRYFPHLRVPAYSASSSPLDDAVNIHANRDALGIIHAQRRRE